ncbi:MAG: AraC family transcriptional regulator [Humidesulfovibrio sp.]|nr:AraC family transcriptional regulator [Humidesulfovibrio sp.]
MPNKTEKTCTSSPSSRQRCSSQKSGRAVRLVCADGLPGVTLAIAQSSRAVQPRHVHDSLVLGVVTAGARRIVAAATQSLAGKGMVFVLLPGQAHACAPAKMDAIPNDTSNEIFDDKSGDNSATSLPACSYVALSIAPEAMPPGLANLRLPSPRLDDPALAESLTRLAEALGAPTGLLERQSLLAECCERLAGHGNESRRQDGRETSLTAGDKVSEVVCAAQRLIEENLEQGVDLAGLAEACGVGMFALHRAFTRAVGLPPHAFQTHLRLRRAKDLLRGGTSLTDAALASGFCDQAHMTRHFARVVGLSPAQYARAHRHRKG